MSGKCCASGRAPQDCQGLHTCETVLSALECNLPPWLHVQGTHAGHGFLAVSGMTKDILQFAQFLLVLIVHMAVNL